MSEKVKVTKEVADAIGNFENTDGYGWSNREIMQEHMSTTRVDCKYRLAIRRLDTDTLMSALINGYEVEETPADLLREHYVDLRRYSKGTIYAREADIIEKTLKLLGITIEGVNA